MKTDTHDLLKMLEGQSVSSYIRIDREKDSIDRIACEVCGDPATSWTQDLKQRLALPDEDSTRAHWEPDGPRHYYCADHFRRAKVKHLTSKDLRSE